MLAALRGTHEGGRPLAPGAPCWRLGTVLGYQWLFGWVVMEPVQSRHHRFHGNPPRRTANQNKLQAVLQKQWPPYERDFLIHPKR